MSFIFRSITDTQNCMFLNIMTGGISQKWAIKVNKHSPSSVKHQMCNMYHTLSVKHNHCCVMNWAWNQPTWTWNQHDIDIRETLCILQLCHEWHKVHPCNVFFVTSRSTWSAKLTTSRISNKGFFTHGAVNRHKKGHIFVKHVNECQLRATKDLSIYRALCVL